MSKAEPHDQLTPYIMNAGHELKPNAKAPSTAHGFKDAPTPIRQGYNGAISLSLTDLIVLDVDCKSGNDGHGSIQDAGLEIPATLTVKTPSGGAHYYYTRPEDHKPLRSCNALADVDVLSGGSVVVPPSVIDGKPYAIVSNAPIAGAPQWLLDFNKPRVYTKASGKVLGDFSPRSQSEEVELVRSALQAIPIQKYPEWIRVCAAVWDAVGESDGTSLLQEWSYEPEGDNSYDTKYRNKLDDVHAGTLFKMAQDNGWSYPKGNKANKAVLEWAANLDYAALREQLDVQPNPTVKKKKEPKIMPSIEVGMQNMPRSAEEAAKARPPVIIDGLLYQGAKLLIGAAAKVGKSHFTMGLCAALAQGQQFLKWQSDRQLKVLYIDFELMGFELRERMANSFGFNVPDNVGRLSLRNYADVRSPAALGLVLDALDVSQYDVVIFDCLYKFNDAEDENGNAEMKNVCSWLDGIAGKYKFAALVIHHFGKGAQSGKSIVDRFRGGSALAGDFDALLAIAPHEEDDHFIIESEVRSFKRTTPFVARWDYPNFVLAANMDATKHLDKGGRKGAPDSELLKKIPVGKDKAMRFDQLGIDLTKDAFNKRVQKIKSVNTCQKKNINNRNETHYYRENNFNGILIAG